MEPSGGYAKVVVRKACGCFYTSREGSLRTCMNPKTDSKFAVGDELQLHVGEGAEYPERAPGNLERVTVAVPHGDPWWNDENSQLTKDIMTACMALTRLLKQRPNIQCHDLGISGMSVVLQVSARHV